MATSLFLLRSIAKDAALFVTLRMRTRKEVTASRQLGHTGQDGLIRTNPDNTLGEIHNNTFKYFFIYLFEVLSGHVKCVGDNSNIGLGVWPLPKI